MGAGAGGTQPAESVSGVVSYYYFKLSDDKHDYLVVNGVRYETLRI